MPSNASITWSGQGTCGGGSARQIVVHGDLIISVDSSLVLDRTLRATGRVILGTGAVLQLNQASLIDGPLSAEIEASLIIAHRARLSQKSSFARLSRLVVKSDGGMLVNMGHLKLAGALLEVHGDFRIDGGPFFLYECAVCIV